MAAASIKYMSRQKWREYVDGVSEQGFDASRTAGIIRDWIEAYLQECTTTIASLVELSKSEKEKDTVELILSRWKQIHRLCERAVESMAA
jgi:ferritin